MQLERHDNANENVNAQDRLNQRIYHDPNIHRWYRSDSLDQCEVAALLKYQPCFMGRDVLDIGIGTGRTTRYLAPLAGRYVGTDYSPPMIEFVRVNMPDVTTELADMRDLSGYPDASFDFVLASCNVIDAVSHDDRLRTLGEVHRALRPGGVFMFSSHNRRYERAMSGPWLVRVHNPATQLAYVQRYVRGMINHSRVGKFRRVEAEYALLNDQGHDYAALHYYIDRDAQQRQLDRAGFTLLDAFDPAGRALASHETDAHAPSLLYVAQRVADDQVLR